MRTATTTQLFWGLLWRSVVWYTVVGAVLGGLYGCAFLAVSVFSVGASDNPDTSALLWALRGVIALLGATGAVVGWAIAARSLGREVRPLIGAVVGALVGISSGGFPLVFFYFFAFPIGAFYGGAYGLAVGLVDAFLTVTITYAFFIPLSDVRKHRRVVVGASVLGVLVVPVLWFVWWIRSEGYEGFGELTGSSLADALVYVGFPPLVLALVAEWLGNRLASWYERRAPRVPPGSAEEPTLLRALRNRRAARLTLYVALALAGSLALAAGILAYQGRTVSVDAPSGWVRLSLDGKQAFALAPSQFQIFDVQGRRSIYTLSLSEPETRDGESHPWSTNGELLATYDGKRVHVYDVPHASEIATLPAENVGKLAWSQDGSALAARIQHPYSFYTNEDRDPVLIWEREGDWWSRAVPVYEGQRGWSEEAMALSSDGNTFAISDYHDVHLWDTHSGHLLRSVRAPGTDLSADYSIAFSPNAEVLAAGGSDGEVSVWCIREGRLLWTDAGHDRYVTALSFSPDGGYLISGGIDGKVKLWRAEDGELLETHGRREEEVGSVTGVGFEPERGQVVSFDQADGLVRIWAKQKRAPEKTSTPDATWEDKKSRCESSE